MKPETKSSNTSMSAKNCYETMFKLLNSRLEFGRKKYGHGVIIDIDTRTFGTKSNDWELMALEEMLDGIIYTAASIIRLYRDHNYHSDREKEKTSVDGVLDDNEEIMETIKKFINRNNKNNKNKLWELVALEEMLNSLIKITNMIIKYREKKEAMNLS